MESVKRLVLLSQGSMLLSLLFLLIGSILTPGTEKSSWTAATIVEYKKVQSQTTSQFTCTTKLFLGLNLLKRVSSGQGCCIDTNSPDNGTDTCPESVGVYSMDSVDCYETFCSPCHQAGAAVYSLIAIAYLFGAVSLFAAVKRYNIVTLEIRLTRAGNTRGYNAEGDFWKRWGWTTMNGTAGVVMIFAIVMFSIWHGVCYQKLHSYILNNHSEDTNISTHSSISLGAGNVLTLTGLALSTFGFIAGLQATLRHYNIYQIDSRARRQTQMMRFQQHMQIGRTNEVGGGLETAVAGNQEGDEKLAIAVAESEDAAGVENVVGSDVDIVIVGSVIGAVDPAAIPPPQQPSHTSDLKDNRLNSPNQVASPSSGGFVVVEEGGRASEAALLQLPNDQEGAALLSPGHE
ncbi:hypothetical protein AAMO2058_001187900 [Amorphochlora amoebiformis]